MKLNFDQISQGRRSKAKLHIVPMVENNENNRKMALIKACTTMYPFVVAIVAGMYIGVSARSEFESYIYACVLFLESLACVIAGCLSRNSVVRAKVGSFMYYFALAGIVCPTTCHAWIYLVSRA